MSASPRVRLRHDDRREQLLDLGVQLFATRTLDELGIDVLAEAAGISRGLLYHYFGNKQEFHEAVVRRAVEELIEVTGPVDSPDLIARMSASLENYIDYVLANHTGYLSILRAAQGGNEAIREIYVSARGALTDRIFESATAEELEAVGLVDSPAMRMLARGWSAMVEYVVLDWVEDDRGLSKEQLIQTLALSLAGIAASLP